MRLIKVVVLLTIAFLFACRPDPAPPPPPITPTPAPEIVRIGVATGATAVADLVTAHYYPANNLSEVQFVSANTATLFDDLSNGAFDAILVHHIPAGDDNWFNPIALDGVVFIVHPDNPIAGLNSGDVQALYSGQFADWTAVGGTNVPVTLFSRERGAGTRTIFTQRLMGEQRISINARIQPDDGSLVTAVADDPHAIGYSMMGNNPLPTGIKILTLDGFSANTASTADQTYPLTTPLYFVSPEEPTGSLRALLAWLQSDAGQMVLGQRYGRVK